MLIAITVEKDQGKMSELEPRFGRAQGFLICDSESGETNFLSNQQNVNALQGAGIQAAQHVVESGAQAVITGHCGPKAFRVLKTAGIDLYLCKGGKVEELLKQWKQGTLESADSADREGHWV